MITLADNGVERTSDATATIRFTSSEAGTVYYSLVSADAVDTSATGTTMVSGDNTLDIVGLTTGEAKVYIKAKTLRGMLPSPFWKLRFRPMCLRMRSY